MAMLITGATILNAVDDTPVEGHSIWIVDGRIKAIGPESDIGAPPDIEVLDARGKYIIPGLMNANVHLYAAFSLEGIIRYAGQYDKLIVEAAQVALRNGLTTVFDTWGPRRALMMARDRIAAGEVPGSRIYCAGNIIGFDGPLSDDFLAKAPEVVSALTVKRINPIWVENVGRHLMWQTPEEVAKEVETYISKGIDFVKYAANDHAPGAFLAFSSRVQAAIVEEAHRAGVTAQAHSMSVEGLWAAIEAGCDLVTHCNVTGPVLIPDTTLRLLEERKTGAVVFPWTERALEWIRANVMEREKILWTVADQNITKLIQSDAQLLLANDGAIYPVEMKTDPVWAKWSVSAPEDNLFSLSDGHFTWFRAMEEKGCSPMRMLKAATINIAVAYGKDRDLGTIERGKIADLLVLGRNPLDAAENYRSLETVIKDGKIVERNALPLEPILTAPLEASSEEEDSYIPFIPGGSFPLCPMCMRH